MAKISWLPQAQFFLLHQGLATILPSTPPSFWWRKDVCSTHTDDFHYLGRAAEMFCMHQWAHAPDGEYGRGMVEPSLQWARSQTASALGLTYTEFRCLCINHTGAVPTHTQKKVYSSDPYSLSAAERSLDSLQAQQRKWEVLNLQLQQPMGTTEAPLLQEDQKPQRSSSSASQCTQGHKIHRHNCNVLLA